MRSLAVGDRSSDAQPRGPALLAIAALLAQIALPPLHARVVARGLDPSTPVATPGELLLQVAVSRRHVPVHHASDCPVCRSLLQARRFLAAPGPAPAPAPRPRPVVTRLRVAPVSIAAARLASSRAPPRRA